MGAHRAGNARDQCTRAAHGRMYIGECISATIWSITTRAASGGRRCAHAARPPLAHAQVSRAAERQMVHNLHEVDEDVCITELQNGAPDARGGQHKPQSGRRRHTQQTCATKPRDNRCRPHADTFGNAFNTKTRVPQARSPDTSCRNTT